MEEGDGGGGKWKRRESCREGDNGGEGREGKKGWGGSVTVKATTT